MSEGTSFYVLKREDFLTVEHFADKLLGAVIQDPKLPFGQAKKSQLHQPQCRTLPFLEDGVAIAARGTSFAPSLSLQDLVDFSITKSRSTELRVNAEWIRQRRISNLDEYWEALLADSAFMASIYPWIRSVQKAKSACLITGLMLCKNAHVEEVGKQTSKIVMGGRLPLVAILAATQAVPLPFDVPEDPGASFERERTTLAASSGNIAGEMIIGLRYQRLRRPLFKTLPELLSKGLQTKYGFSPRQQLSGDGDPDAESNQEAIVKRIAPMVVEGTVGPSELCVERDELNWVQVMAEDDLEREDLEEAAKAASDVESEEE